MAKSDKEQAAKDAEAKKLEQEQKDADKKLAQAKKDVKKAKVTTLFFAESFWCKELDRSIKKGTYVPTNDAEAKILIPRASRII